MTVVVFVVVVDEEGDVAEEDAGDERGGRRDDPVTISRVLVFLTRPIHPFTTHPHIHMHNIVLLHHLLHLYSLLFFNPGTSISVCEGNPVAVFAFDPDCAVVPFA